MLDGTHNNIFLNRVGKIIKKIILSQILHFDKLYPVKFANNFRCLLTEIEILWLGKRLWWKVEYRTWLVTH